VISVRIRRHFARLRAKKFLAKVVLGIAMEKGVDGQNILMQASMVGNITVT
jgi:hypothetical protein